MFPAALVDGIKRDLSVSLFQLPICTLFISDFDHTITYGKESDWFAFRVALERAHLPVPDKKTFFSLRHEGDSRSVARRLCHNDSELCARVLRTREKLMNTEVVRNKARLRPGAKESIRRLRKKVRFMAIASTGNKAAIVRFLKREGLNGCFDAVEARNVTGKNQAKSELAKLSMYLGLLKRFGARPEETLVLGNSINDLRPALKIGCRAIAIAGDYGLEDGLADIVFHVMTWQELLNSLGKASYRTGPFWQKTADVS